MRTYFSFRNLFFYSCLLCFFLTGFAGNAQTATVYGNEWINYGQPYYKIKVVNNGMHRLTYNDLVAAGISNVNPQKFQLFRRGREMAIYVNGQSDGVLNAGDYIDFYGKKNDGEMDVDFYSNPANQPHKYYSLFTDTAAYFLTWGNANGKRMVEKTSQTAGLTPEPRHYGEKLKLFTSVYFAGFKVEYTESALGDLSESYLTNYYGRSRRDTISNITNVDLAGPNPVLETGVVSAFFYPSKVLMYIKPPTGPERLLTNSVTGSSGIINIPAFDHRNPKFNILPTDIHPNGTVNIRSAIADSISTTVIDLIRLSHYKITYPKTNNLNNADQEIFTDSLKTTPSYFLFNNPPVNAIGYDITDPYNVIRTEGVTVGNQRGFVFDPSPQRRKIIIAKAETTSKPAAIKSVTFNQVVNPANFDYFIITHKSLRVPVAGSPYLDPPADYAAYRASTQGGGYKPFVMNIDDVYDQFHYGDKSPFAISRMMKWLVVNGQPKFLFLVGRGLQKLAGSPEGNVRAEPLKYSSLGMGEDLIPTYAYPPSDVLLTADWKNNSFAPQVPTGRLPAVNGKQVADYLDKVKEHEALGNEEWRKNFLHLGGGDVSKGEHRVFANYLNNYKNKVEGPHLGARVKSIIRDDGSGTGFTGINISKDLNAGLSFITFFGHSAPGISDLDMGYVTDPAQQYNNQGKYPMILMNGCNAGNAFLLKDTVRNRFSLGEDWILAPKKGAILFLAHTLYALPHALNNYSTHFYNVAFTDSAFYGRPVGEIQKETIRRSLINSPNNWEYKSVAQEMLLQGDPAIRLFSPEKPDYLVKTNGLKLQSIPKGEVVTASDESFDLIIDVRNSGKAVEDSLIIAVKRTLPNGSVIQYPARKFAPVFNDKTVTYTINSKNVSGFGENKFEVFLDYGDSIDELNEANNTAILIQYLSVNGVIALLPKEFDIVNTSTVKLVGQPAKLLSPKRDYYFELDTIPTFNSAIKKSTIISNAGSNPSWTTTLMPTAPNDSVVFYWRFRFNTFGPKEDTIWAESSFRYIPNSPEGWSQSHYGQYAKNDQTQVTIDPVTKRLEFSPLNKELLLKTTGGGNTFNNSHGIYLDNVFLTSGNCIFPTDTVILVTVFNNRNLVPITNLTTPPGSKTIGKCGFSTWNYYFKIEGKTLSADVTALADFIRVQIPNGAYVAMVSQNNVPFSSFTSLQRDAFKLIGSNKITTLATGDPFAIVGQKGATAAQAVLLQEKSFDATNTTPHNLQNIDFTQIITGRGTQGTLTSTRIGPASQWTTLHHTVKKSGRDEYKLDLYGYDKAGTRQLLAQNINTQTYSLSTVDAKVYPFLQLQLALTDTAARTAPQLKQWMVVYQGVPEGMMRPDLVGIEEYNIDKEAASGKVNLRFAFQNISKHDFPDSLTVVRSVVGTGLQDTIMVRKLTANGDSVFFDYSFSTGGMRGNNVARVEVNPGIFPEQYYFNNFLEVPFTLPNADLHPTLDVAFDGRRIMDGDIVSPSPKINISLKDEDKYDFIKDPDNLQVFLKRPGNFNYERIDLQDPNLVTLPNMTDPNRDKREFSIIYNPKNLPDSPEGEDYILRVQGQDNSEHEAGFQPYTISFKVVNESAITHFYPYPNPFTSNTRFVFTLTGNPENMPRNLKIQIMTLTGKVVREIQKEELGPIHVGNNMSEPWNGTDEYGDKLANGVYLYRVVMDTPPLEEMKHRKTSADKAFHKEYGKLYILR